MNSRHERAGRDIQASAGASVTVPPDPEPTVIDCSDKYNPHGGLGEGIGRAVALVLITVFLGFWVYLFWPINFDLAAEGGRFDVLVLGWFFIVGGAMYWGVLVRAAPAPISLEVRPHSLTYVYPRGRRREVPMTPGRFSLRLKRPPANSRFQAASFLHSWLTIGEDQLADLVAAMEAQGVSVKKQAGTSWITESVTFTK